MQTAVNLHCYVKFLFSKQQTKYISVSKSGQRIENCKVLLEASGKIMKFYLEGEKL